MDLTHPMQSNTSYFGGHTVTWFSAWSTNEKSPPGLISLVDQEKAEK
jgi:hypothetical protein